jgi:peptide deformylase
MKKYIPKTLTVIGLGHPTLRKKAKEVKDLGDPKLVEFIQDLTLTIKSFKGVGIAAPQVDKSIRVLVIASSPSLVYPKAPRMKPLVMINPVMVGHSAKMVKGWEGCGSLLGVRAQIMRYVWTDVEFIDVKGKKASMHLKDFLARVFQHELDHLNGIMFIDHVPKSALVSDKWFQATVVKKLKEKSKKKK